MSTSTDSNSAAPSIDPAREGDRRGDGADRREGSTSSQLPVETGNLPTASANREGLDSKGVSETAVRRRATSLPSTFERGTFEPLRFDPGAAFEPSRILDRPILDASPSTRIELFYDSIAERFDAIMNQYDMQRRVETVFDEFLGDVDLSGRELLDAGCGTGWFSLRACQRGAKVTALDIGPRLLEQVRRKCSARTVCGDVLDLQFDDASFDVVISSECIEHTGHAQTAIRELIRVCRPGGLVAITTNNHFWYWLCALANKLRLRPYEGIEDWPRWSDFGAWVSREPVRILDRRGLHLFPFQISLLHPVLRFMDRFGRFFGPVCVNQAILAIKQC